MFFLVCPRCSRVEPRWLQFLRAIADADYYRCDGCGGVFRVPTDLPDGLVRQVRQITIVLPPCPSCQQFASCHLETSSKEAIVNYYRCGTCGHVWNVSKAHPEAPPISVTVPK